MPRAGLAAGQPPTLVASLRMAMRAATASSALGPAAETMTCWPVVAPRPITPSTLLASAVWPPAVTRTAEANRPADTERAPAGRACRPPPRVIPRSQLADMACLLRGGGHRLDVPASGSRDRGGDGALHERRVGEQHVRVGAVGLGHRLDGQYRAAQVRQHDVSCAAVGDADTAGHLGRVGAKAAVVGAARRD